MAGLTRVGYTVIHMPPQQNQKKREDSPKSITDEKIGKLECVICLTNKISEEMQTIPHKKYKENDLNGKKKCIAHEEPSLCRTCVMQLNPKICPLCTDELSLTQENFTPAQPLAITQNQQVNINMQSQLGSIAQNQNIIINIQPPVVIAQNQQAVVQIQAPGSRYRCTWVRIAKLSIALGMSAFVIFIIGRGFGTCGDQINCPPNETWKGWW